MATLRSNPRIVGYQTWHQLLFLHWRVPPDAIQALLPNGLTVQTCDNAAWIGLVPFAMQRVRPWWSPPVPGISWFLETNIRTYVCNDDGQSGVWFFSLDANHRLAVSVARKFWHLNYVMARLSLTADEDGMAYEGGRLQDPDCRYDISAVPVTDDGLRQAAADTLEYFLLERYHLFAQRPDGRFLCGQVHHEPYSYYHVSSLSVRQTMLAKTGIAVAEDALPDHVAFSPGVDVKVSPLHLI